MTIEPGREAAVSAAITRAQTRASQQQPGREAGLTLRVTAQERALLEMAAALQGETLSAFVRTSALDVADALIEASGGLTAFTQRFSEEQGARIAKTIDTVTG